MKRKLVSKKPDCKKTIDTRVTKQQLSKATGGAEAVKTTLGPKGRNVALD